MHFSHRTSKTSSTCNGRGWPVCFRGGNRKAFDAFSPRTLALASASSVTFNAGSRGVLSQLANREFQSGDQSAHTRRQIKVRERRRRKQLSERLQKRAVVLHSSTRKETNSPGRAPDANETLHGRVESQQGARGVYEAVGALHANVFLFVMARMSAKDQLDCISLYKTIALCKSKGRVPRRSAIVVLHNLPMGRTRTCSRRVTSISCGSPIPEDKLQPFNRGVKNDFSEYLLWQSRRGEIDRALLLDEGQRVWVQNDHVFQALEASSCYGCVAG